MARILPHDDGGTIMTKAIRLTVDATLSGKLEELADFHGESIEDTLRPLIRHAHADMRRFYEEDFGKNGEKAPHWEPQPDDEIPM
jgi:hypothetical protein